MEIHFLGTSAGLPSKTRNVTACAIKMKHHKRWYLVDCGEATQHQLLRSPLSLNSLDAVFITHIHGDHCYGLPGILASSAMSGRKHALTLVGHRDLKRYVEGVIDSTQLHLPFSINFIDVESLQSPLITLDFTVTAIPLSHRVPCFAYEFTELARKRKLDKDKLIIKGIEAGSVWGRLQAGNNVTFNGEDLLSEDYLLPAPIARTVVICGDNDSPALLNAAAANTQVLVHEATYTQEVADKVGTGPQHSSAKQVATFAQERGFKNLILTHFSTRYQDGLEKQPSINSIRIEAEACYTGNLFLAKDFEMYHLNDDGTLHLKRNPHVS